MLKPKNSRLQPSKVFFEFLLCLCFIFLVREDHYAHFPKDLGQLTCSFSVHTWLNTPCHGTAWVILGFIDQQSGQKNVKRRQLVHFSKSQTKNLDYTELQLLIVRKLTQQYHIQTYSGNNGTNKVVNAKLFTEELFIIEKMGKT